MRWRQASVAGLVLGLVAGRRSAARGAGAAARRRARGGGGGDRPAGGPSCPAGRSGAWSTRATVRSTATAGCGRSCAAADGAWLQAALVARGEAIVAPAADVPAAALTELLAARAGGAAAGLGVWADGAHGPWPAERVAAAPRRLCAGAGHGARGRAAQAPSSISTSARTGDATSRCGRKPRPRRRSREPGSTSQGLPGRRILVRGWLFESAGPMIELVHPAQIEVEE